MKVVGFVYCVVLYWQPPCHNRFHWWNSMGSPRAKCLFTLQHHWFLFYSSSCLCIYLSKMVHYFFSVSCFHIYVYIPGCFLSRNSIVSMATVYRKDMIYFIRCSLDVLWQSFLCVCQIMQLHITQSVARYILCEQTESVVQLVHTMWWLSAYWCPTTSHLTGTVGHWTTE